VVLKAFSLLWLSRSAEAHNASLHFLREPSKLSVMTRERTMDLKKLKLEKFKNIQIVNFPKDIDLGISSTGENVEVIIYYIQQLEDLQGFVRLAESTCLPTENRTILVYEKGRQDGVNRDSIIGPFQTNQIKGFKLKQPTLCSISDKLSAFVLCKEP
jgi:hypothetical protein